MGKTQTKLFGPELDQLMNFVIKKLIKDIEIWKCQDQSKTKNMLKIFYPLCDLKTKRLLFFFWNLVKLAEQYMVF